MRAASDLVIGFAGRIANGFAAAAGAVAAHKRIAVAAAGAVVLAAGGLGVWFIWLAPPPAPPAPEDQSPEQIRDYLASRDFAAQPAGVRQAYFEKAVASGTDSARRRRLFGRGELTDEQRQQLRRNVRPLFEKMMQKRMDEYFALPPEQRTAEMEKMIDRMMAWQRQRGEGQPPRDGQAGAPGEGQRRGGRAPSLERIKQRIENTPPEDRAKWMEFIKDLRKRMEQRGIEFPPRRGRPPR